MWQLRKTKINNLQNNTQTNKQKSKPADTHSNRAGRSQWLTTTAWTHTCKLCQTQQHRVTSEQANHGEASIWKARRERESLPVTELMENYVSSFCSVEGQGSQHTETIKDFFCRWDGDSFLHARGLNIYSVWETSCETNTVTAQLLQLWGLDQPPSPSNQTNMSTWGKASLQKLHKNNVCVVYFNTRGRWRASSEALQPCDHSSQLSFQGMFSSMISKNKLCGVVT